MIKPVRDHPRPWSIPSSLSVGLLLFSTALAANAPTPAGAPVRSQFLLIVDDSGSMGNAPPGTDRDRLAILASRVFLTLLGPEDRVNAAGMNELAARKTEWDLLTPSRAIEEAKTRLDPNTSSLASYKGRVLVAENDSNRNANNRYEDIKKLFEATKELLGFTVRA